MKAFMATFTKKDGSTRTMKFVKLCDLPSQFMNEQVKGTGQARNFQDKKELVWDLEAAGFRVFNWDTLVGEPITLNVRDNVFNIKKNK